MDAPIPDLRANASRARTPALLLLAALICLCLPASADETAAAARLAPFKLELMQALKSGVEEGPVEAIDACQVHAPKIGIAHAREGLRVGRTSHRLRNPANAGPAWVEPILAAYRQDANDRTPRSVQLPGGRTGYVEPILTQSLCLTCHGSALAPEVALRLAERYPEDRATGFAEGELRGVFWIELPMDTD